MPAYNFGEKPLGLRDLWISTFNPLTGTQGTAIALPESNKFTAKATVGSDQLKASLKVTSAAAWAEAYEFEIGWNGLPFDAMVILFGSAFAAQVNSDSSPNRKRTANLVPGVLFPNFSVAGYSMAEGDGGFAQGFYKCMITEAEYGMAEDGKFYVSNGKGICLAHEVTSGNYRVGRYRTYETGITFDATAFAALFTAG